ncbi:MAG: hypothetical protein HY898_09090 [Deltaproteobacteria bacterium]|nr:hypothetical protein [Deltaproteobacteria bacterium]
MLLPRSSSGWLWGAPVTCRRPGLRYAWSFLVVGTLGAAALSTGCATASQGAICRERAKHRFDPGVVRIAEGDRELVRTIRCEGAYGDSPCSDDALARLAFTVTTTKAHCPAGKSSSACWWENQPGSSHGDATGQVDSAGTYMLSGVMGGSTRLVAHVGDATAQAIVRVRLVLVENPGHVPRELLERLDSASREASGVARLLSPADGALWLTDQGDGKSVSLPRLEIESSLRAARVHVENASGTLTYDGTFASSPITLSRAVWNAISRSTEQNEKLKVRVTAITTDDAAQSAEQRWGIDHGRFYHSPEDLAGDRRNEARAKAERERFEREWIRTHSYLPEGDAIALAVRFLREQGFTNEPPAGPVRHDIMDFGTDAEVLARRRGSIDPKPVGTKKKAGWWWVAFQRVGGEPCSARVVAVSADGKRMRMIHQHISLATFD